MNRRKALMCIAAFVVVSTVGMALWNFQRGPGFVRHLTGHKAGINCVAFSPTFELVATGSDDASVRVWSAHTGEFVRAFFGHKKAILDVEFSADGKQLATGSRDKSGKIWDVETGLEKRSDIKHEKGVANVAFSSNGQWLATSSWDETVCVRSPYDGKLLHNLMTKGSQKALTFSPDSRFLVSSGEDPVIKVWDTESFKVSTELTHHDHGVVCCDFSPDGKLMASASADGEICIWEVDTWRLAMALAIEEDLVHAVSFFSDGRRLAVVGRSTNVSIFDAVTGKLLHVWSGHPKQINDISCSQEAESVKLVTGGYGKTALLWMRPPSTDAAADPK